MATRSFVTLALIVALFAQSCQFLCRIGINNSRCSESPDQDDKEYDVQKKINRIRERIASLEKKIYEYQNEDIPSLEKNINEIQQSNNDSPAKKVFKDRLKKTKDVFIDIKNKLNNLNENFKRYINDPKNLRNYIISSTFFDNLESSLDDLETQIKPASNEIAEYHYEIDINTSCSTLSPKQIKGPLFKLGTYSPSFDKTSKLINDSIVSFLVDCVKTHEKSVYRVTAIHFTVIGYADGVPVSEHLSQKIKPECLSDGKDTDDLNGCLSYLRAKNTSGIINNELNRVFYGKLDIHPFEVEGRGSILSGGSILPNPDIRRCDISLWLEIEK